MGELHPFDLVPLEDGRFELKAFSDDSDDPMSITLHRSSGRLLVAALGEALATINAHASEAQEFEVSAGERLITVTALQKAVRLTVTR